MNDEIETYVDDMEIPLSECCGAEIWYSDICSECKEHCTATVECQACKGSGSIFKNEENSRCPICDGDGYIILLEE